VWQSFPKALRARADRLEVAIWPQEAAEALALDPGVARTHVVTLVPYGSPEELDAFVTGLFAPILPEMDARQWNSAGVMPPVLPADGTPVPFIETLTRTLFTGYSTYANRSNVGVWGLGEMHWGDFRAESYEKRALPDHYGRDVVWGNQEAQVPYGFLVQYLRTGRCEYLLQGLACARHQADVDTCHDAEDPQSVGGQYAHCAGHTGLPGLSISHQWTSGIALAWCLTGDGRLREVLHETRGHLVHKAREHDLAAFEARDGGWLLISLCALAEALDDAQCLSAGGRVLKGIRQWIDAGALMTLPPMMRAHTPVHLFIALTGVADFWRLTGDAFAKETLLAGGELAMRRGRDESGFFFIADGPVYRQAGRWPACHSLPVLSDLYEITGDRRWLEAGVHQARLMLRLMEMDTRWGLEENWAQGGIYFAYAFRFFEAAHRAGLLRDIA